MDEAAFDPAKTAPEEEMERAGEESGVSFSFFLGSVRWFFLLGGKGVGGDESDFIVI